MTQWFKKINSKTITDDIQTEDDPLHNMAFGAR